MEKMGSDEGISPSLATFPHLQSLISSSSSPPPPISSPPSPLPIPRCRRLSRARCTPPSSPRSCPSYPPARSPPSACIARPKATPVLVFWTPSSPSSSAHLQWLFTIVYSPPRAPSLPDGLPRAGRRGGHPPAGSKDAAHPAGPFRVCEAATPVRAGDDETVRRRRAVPFVSFCFQVRTTTPPAAAPAPERAVSRSGCSVATVRSSSILEEHTIRVISRALAPRAPPTTVICWMYHAPLPQCWYRHC